MYEILLYLGMTLTG